MVTPNNFYPLFDNLISGLIKTERGLSNMEKKIMVIAWGIDETQVIGVFDTMEAADDFVNDRENMDNFDYVSFIEVGELKQNSPF
jgi:hypothetical protein